jgi:uncharacterized protein (DUF2126 family)
MGASSNHACATCPTVATGEARPSLLGHHSSDRIATTSCLPVVIEGYGLLVQRRIVVVRVTLSKSPISATVALGSNQISDACLESTSQITF